jgi:aryl-alcohol dehydrogenase-like predicted oxidoreductase
MLYIVTKLPNIPDNCSSVQQWVEASVEASMQRLNVGSLYGLLLHHPADLQGPLGEDLYEAIQGLQRQGWIRKVGVSIYRPEELDNLYHRFDMDLVQAPFNGLDQRLVTSGWLARLQKDGIEVHGRSLFLQGLLLMPARARPSKFDRWRSLWKQWDDWLATQKVTPLQACLGCAWHQAGLDRFVVGVDSLVQWQEIIKAIKQNYLPQWPSHISTDDLDLINPARWSSL